MTDNNNNNNKTNYIEWSNYFFDIVGTPPECKHITKDIRTLTLFVSYDIVNSTKLKLKYIDKWQDVIEILVSRKLESTEFWKFNGDEIIFKRDFDSLGYLCQLIKQSYSHLKKVQEEMKNVINCDDDDELLLKGTIWIALNFDKSSPKYKFNYRFVVNDIMDFVGKSMDEGFRLTKCSSLQKIAIDPKIVYILLDAYSKILCPPTLTKVKQKNIFFNSFNNITVDDEKELRNIINQIHLVGYSKCKGVWNDAPYPIYWMYENNDLDGIQYNDYLDDIHLWQKEIKSLGSAYKSEFENLKRIFDYVKINDEISDIYDILKLHGDLLTSSNSKLYFYFTTVCINPSHKKVLVLKRDLKRKHLKGVWEFGYVKQQNEKIKEAIENEYEKILGIKVEVLTDPNRDDNIRVLGYNPIYRYGKKHNSLLCVAIINSDCTDNDIIKKIKSYIKRTPLQQSTEVLFSDCKFINLEELDSCTELTLEQQKIDSQKAAYQENNNFEGKEDIYIPYFKDSVKKALSAIKDYVPSLNEKDCEEKFGCFN